MKHLSEIGRRKRFNQPACRDCKPLTRAVRCEDDKQNVALAIHFFCLRLQCRRERRDGGVAACFAVEFYDHRATPEAVCDDLRCTGRLAPKNALMPEQTE